MDFPEDILKALDAHILKNRKADGINLIRQATGMSLGAAIRALSQRYDLLREQRPDDFTQSHEEYWSGFYS